MFPFLISEFGLQKYSTKIEVNSKFEILNTKQIQMTKAQNSKQYDLED